MLPPFYRRGSQSPDRVTPLPYGAQPTGGGAGTEGPTAPHAVHGDRGPSSPSREVPRPPPPYSQHLLPHHPEKKQISSRRENKGGWGEDAPMQLHFSCASKVKTKSQREREEWRPGFTLPSTSHAQVCIYGSPITCTLGDWSSERDV